MGTEYDAAYNKEEKRILVFKREGDGPVTIIGSLNPDQAFYLSRVIEDAARDAVDEAVRNTGPPTSKGLMQWDIGHRPFPGSEPGK